jgi:hypothetical protein
MFGSVSRFVAGSSGFRFDPNKPQTESKVFLQAFSDSTPGQLFNIEVENPSSPQPTLTTSIATTTEALAQTVVSASQTFGDPSNPAGGSVTIVVSTNGNTIMSVAWKQVIPPLLFFFFTDVSFSKKDDGTTKEGVTVEQWEPQNIFPNGGIVLSNDSWRFRVWHDPVINAFIIKNVTPS